MTISDENSSEMDETINTTDNHPFYVEGKGWVAAIELEEGDILRTSDGDIKTVKDVTIEYLDEPELIYNLEVEGYHTYFVSDENVLVHNDCGSGSKKVPNPDGRKGGAAHRGVIDDIIDDADRKKLNYDTEYRFNTSGRYKDSRYADVVIFDSQGNVMEIHQVGKVNKNGTPVIRESKAIDDIMNSSTYKGATIIFWPYNSDSGPIIYDF